MNILAFFTTTNKKQRVSLLAKRLSVGILEIAEARFRNYVYSANLFEHATGKLSYSKKQVLSAIRPRETDKVLADHLQNRFEKKALYSMGNSDNTEYQNQALQILDTSTWLQPKEYFSYANFAKHLTSADENPYSKIDNAGGQSFFYYLCYSYAAEIEHELENEMPDYTKILKKINELRALNWTVESILNTRNSEEPGKIALQITPYFGKNVFMQLFMGIIGVVGATVAIVSSLLFMLPGYGMNSPYFGTIGFLFDASVYFVNSLLDTITAVIFPLSMIEAYITTDSCNIIQGDLARTLDAIDKYCVQERKKQMIGIAETNPMQVITAN